MSCMCMHQSCERRRLLWNAVVAWRSFVGWAFEYDGEGVQRGLSRRIRKDRDDNASTEARNYVEIIIHAGLHKSGTSSVQMDWVNSYKSPGHVWNPVYPEYAGGTHHSLFWPLLSQVVNRVPTEIEFYREHPFFQPRDLRAVIEQAVGHGVSQLLLSSEELDRLVPEDALQLAAILGNHKVTALFTVTKPIHRWGSGWQELVKHGLASPPTKSYEHILRFASLKRGRLEELIRAFPATRKLVRVVRTDPPEPDLSASLQHLLRLPSMTRSVVPTFLNQSLGADIELLRVLNTAGLTTGTMDDASRELFESLRPSWRRESKTTEENPLYRVDPSILDTAESEVEFLIGADKRDEIELFDPWNQLAGWSTMEPASWYRDVAHSTWTSVPGLPPGGHGDLAWRNRLRLSTARITIETLQKELEGGAIRAAERDATLIKQGSALRELQAKFDGERGAWEATTLSNMDLRTELIAALGEKETLCRERDDALAQVSARDVEISLRDGTLSWRITRPLRAIRSLLPGKREYRQ